MPSCLGLYIENKLIKYAKVSVEKEQTTIENFGIEFYEDLPKTIAQIIVETASEKTPISINIDGETYDYFKIFSLLSKKDLEKAVATEVETIYFEKGLNVTSVDSRYLLSPIKDESDRFRALNVTVSKARIMEKTNIIGNAKLASIVPLPIVLPDLIKTKENSLIVNIEERTTFTSIINGYIYEVESSKNGMSQILEQINFKENSYAKAYEICKNTTIYTSDIAEIESDANLYLEDIMPTLYNVVQDMNRVLESLPTKISKIYITGSAALINNIDLYFKEYLEDIECVILKPHFIDQSKTKINVKDYIEVNSAIAVALSVLEEKKYNINFYGKSNKTKSASSSGSSKGSKLNVTMPKFDTNIKGPLDNIEIALIRGAVSVLLIFVIYMAFSGLLTRGINKKNEEIAKVKTDVQTQINLVKSDLTKLQGKVASYRRLRTNLENINQKVAENYRTKNMIPNLLYHIMNIIPVNVQITSIENTADRHIVINAQTTDYDNYEYLAYFTVGLKNGGILTNVVAGAAERQDEIIKVTIEGDLQ